MKKRGKSKIRRLLNEYPAIKIYGASGVIIIVLLFVVSTVFSSKIARLWDNIFHQNTSSPVAVVDTGTTDANATNPEEDISIDLPEYTPGLYSSDKISFKYPEDWIPSEGNGSIVSVNGFQRYDDRHIEYVFSVLDITNDLSTDINEYVYGQMTEETLPGGIGSFSAQPIGHYSGVWTGYLYYDGAVYNFYEDENADDKIRSVSIAMLTDGKTRVYTELKTPNLKDSESYDEQILEDILDSFVIK